MVRWQFKGCSRCGGDIFVDRDQDGWYEQCLQCAYRHELRELLAEEEKQPATVGKTANRRRHPF